MDVAVAVAVAVAEGLEESQWCAALAKPARFGAVYGNGNGNVHGDGDGDGDGDGRSSLMFALDM